MNIDYRAMEIVKAVSRFSCNCQTNLRDVESNFHRDSCYVGQAQKLLRDIHENAKTNSNDLRPGFDDE